MLNELKKTELDYTRCFTENEESDNIIRFWDNRLANMYCHNFTFIKKELTHEELMGIIEEEIRKRREEDRGFLQIEVHFPIEDHILEGLSVKPEVSKYDLMYIPVEMLETLGGNPDCEIKEALTPEILEDGRWVDIEVCTPDMGEDFAVKRIARKMQVYSNPKYPLNQYVCYHNGVPMGNVELFINGDIAKIEDFDILKVYQRRGFGTSIIKHLLKRCRDHGAKTAYVITDSEDTAKDMYVKCGFTKIGEKYQLFFSLK
jgi:spore maturation protein CgeE